MTSNNLQPEMHFHAEEANSQTKWKI